MARLRVAVRRMQQSYQTNSAKCFYCDYLKVGYEKRLVLNMSAPLDTLGRRSWTLAAVKMDSRGGQIVH